MLVSVATAHPLCDRTCLLYPGDHPFIRKESYVAYRYMKVVNAQNLIDGVCSRSYVRMSRMDEGVMARILRGVCSSRHTSRKFKEMFECEG